MSEDSSPLEPPNTHTDELLELEIKNLCTKLHTTIEKLLDLSTDEKQIFLFEEENRQMRRDTPPDQAANHSEPITDCAVEKHTLNLLNDDSDWSRALQKEFLCEYLLDITPQELSALQRNDLALKFIESDIRSDTDIREKYLKFLRNRINALRSSKESMKGDKSETENKLRFLCGELGITLEQFKSIERHELAKRFLKKNFGDISKFMQRFSEEMRRAVGGEQESPKVVKLEDQKSQEVQSLQTKHSSNDLCDKLGETESDIYLPMTQYQTEAKFQMLCKALNLRFQEVEKMSAKQLLEAKLCPSNDAKHRRAKNGTRSKEIRADSFLDFILKSIFSSMQSSDSEENSGTSNNHHSQSECQTETISIADLPACYVFLPDLIIHNKRCSKAQMKMVKRFVKEKLC